MPSMGDLVNCTSFLVTWATVTLYWFCPCHHW